MSVRGVVLLDRRFHAQPNACPICGPHTWLKPNGIPVLHPAERDVAVQLARKMLLLGKFLVLKGLDGLNLACAPTKAEAVHTLRDRKRRPARPLRAGGAGPLGCP